MISIVALSSPANADAPATSRDAPATSRDASAIGGDASAIGGEENVAKLSGRDVESDEDEEWEALCEKPIVPIGGGAPILIGSSEPVAPEPAAPKIVKPLKQMPPKSISTQELIVRIVGHFEKDYVRFKNQGVTGGEFGADFNLRDKDMKDPQYGFIGYAMVQAETYYNRIYGNKLSLSKIRSDIDILQSQLRVLIAKKDAAAQIKLCARLDARKADLEEAVKNIELAKSKLSPLNDVRAAIAILRRENDSAYRFCKQFTLYNATKSFEKEVEPEVVVQSIVVTKKTEPAKSTISPAAPVALTYESTGTSSWWDDEPVPNAAAAPKEAVDAPVEAPVKAQGVAQVAATPVVAASKKSVFGKKKLNLM
jgi:hypothetical protein